MQPHVALRLSSALVAIACAGALVALQLRRVRAPHAIVEGAAWRSAQLAIGEFEEFVERKGVRGVLSLRGSSARDDAHDAEVAWCAANGVEHVQVPLTPTRMPTPEQGRALLRALDSLPRPILVHCRQGADRTGLAAAVYLAVEHDTPVEEALDAHLCLLEGHLALGGPRAMDDWFELYGREARGRTLREWIESRGLEEPLADLAR